MHQSKNGVKYQINATITRGSDKWPRVSFEKCLPEALRRHASTGIKRKRKAIVPLYASNKSLIVLGLGHSPRWDDWFVKK